MSFLHPSVKRIARRAIPASVYSGMSRFYKRLSHSESASNTSGSFLQGMRSLTVHGISDGTLHETIQDYLQFNSTNYKSVNDAVRVVSLIEAVLCSNNLSGDIAECGVYQGSSAKIIRRYANPKKTVHLFDTFAGFTEQDRSIEKIKGLGRDPGAGHINTSLNLVKTRVFSGNNTSGRPVNEDSVVFHVGPVQETLQEVRGMSFCLVHLDMDLYAPTKYALEFFISRLVPRGILLLHDYAVPDIGYRGVYQATKEIDMTSLCGPLPFGDQATAMFIKCHPSNNR